MSGRQTRRGRHGGGADVGGRPTRKRDDPAVPIEEEPRGPPQRVDNAGANVVGFIAQLLEAHQQQHAAHQLQQQAQGEALVQVLQQINNQNSTGRMHRMLTFFSGTDDEDIDDWVNLVEAEAVAGGWSGIMKLAMPKAALRGSAARWEPTPEEANEWTTWSTTIKAAFRKRYTFHEWYDLVDARKQRVGESSAQYISEINKFKILCPRSIDEEEFVMMVI